MYIRMKTKLWGQRNCLQSSETGLSLFFLIALCIVEIFPVVTDVFVALYVLSGLLYIGFSACMFGLYSFMPVVIKRTSATAVNLSLLTADLYCLFCGLFLFQYKVRICSDSFSPPHHHHQLYVITPDVFCFLSWMLSRISLFSFSEKVSVISVWNTQLLTILKNMFFRD